MLAQVLRSVQIGLNTVVHIFTPKTKKVQIRYPKIEMEYVYFKAKLGLTDIIADNNVHIGFCTYIERTSLFSKLIVEPVTIPPALELLSDDALEGRTQQCARYQFL